MRRTVLGAHHHRHTFFDTIQAVYHRVSTCEGKPLDSEWMGWTASSQRSEIRLCIPCHRPFGPPAEPISQPWHYRSYRSDFVSSLGICRGFQLILQFLLGRSKRLGSDSLHRYLAIFEINLYPALSILSIRPTPAPSLRNPEPLLPRHRARLTPPVYLELETESSFGPFRRFRGWDFLDGILGGG